MGRKSPVPCKYCGVGTGSATLRFRPCGAQRIAQKLIDMEKRARRDFTDENEDLRVTKATGELALELLDPDEQYKLFTVVGKAAKKPLAPITEKRVSLNTASRERPLFAEIKSVPALSTVSTSKCGKRAGNTSSLSVTSFDPSLNRMASRASC